GSSNLSTPAIFKALAEMLEPFYFLVLKHVITEQRVPRLTKTARVGSSNLSTPAIFKALAEMLEPFLLFGFETCH
ncbi:hypothetical protein, partial [Vibrio toranzoniae]|uniref:hypothetical protein n=1 Tax=Vibrio toranzoniae TaxID=1194427 RepID=UPI001F15F058